MNMRQLLIPLKKDPGFWVLPAAVFLLVAMAQERGPSPGRAGMVLRSPQTAVATQGYVRVRVHSVPLRQAPRRRSPDLADAGGIDWTRGRSEPRVPFRAPLPAAQPPGEADEPGDLFSLDEDEELFLGVPLGDDLQAGEGWLAEQVYAEEARERASERDNWFGEERLLVPEMWIDEEEGALENLYEMPESGYYSDEETEY